jgi:AraC family transcriptional regulator
MLNFLNDLKVGSNQRSKWRVQTLITTVKAMSDLRVSHGSAGQPLVIGPWRLTEASYAPGQRVPRHEHALSSWTFVNSGSIEEKFSRDSFVYGAGTVLTKPAIAEHSNFYGPQPTKCILIEVASSHLDARTHNRLFSRPCLFSSGVVPRLAANIYDEVQRTDTISRFVIESSLLELQLAGMRAHSMPAPIGRKWLSSVRDHLEAAFRSPPSLKELATCHDLHPAYVCQEFRAEFGIGIGAFVRDVRFQWARAAIATSSRPLSDIALAAGFSDQSHMTRDFKRRLGVSPRQYRIATRK